MLEPLREDLIYMLKYKYFSKYLHINERILFVE